MAKEMKTPTEISKHTHFCIREVGEMRKRAAMGEWGRSPKVLSEIVTSEKGFAMEPLGRIHHRETLDYICALHNVWDKVIDEINRLQAVELMYCNGLTIDERAVYESMMNDAYLQIKNLQAELRQYQEEV